jgi:glycosyltransferase involved in cell wall biosynthesis
LIEEVPLKLDIVVPIYNEQDNLDELFKRVSKVGDTLEDVSWRVIYVNDGSRDASLQIMLQQAEKDHRFHILDLSRNFGHQAAITAGLGQATGDAVIMMDGDLQDPPELIPQLVKKWQEGAQVVRAERRSRKERGIRRIGFELFHKVFKWISDFPIPAQSGIFGLLDGRVVKELNKFPEKNRFFPGLRSWVGFSQAVVFYDREERAAGEPKQSLKRLIRYALDAVFSFSYKPLRIMTGLGLIISISGFILAVFFAVRRIIGVEVAATGFTTLVTLILFLGGVQLVAVGLLGEYLARIYDEVKQRPLYIVKKRHGLSEPATGTRDGDTTESLSPSDGERIGQEE